MATANDETKTKTWESTQVFPFLWSSGNGNSWLKKGIPHNLVSSGVIPAAADSVFQDVG